MKIYTEVYTYIYPYFTRIVCYTFKVFHIDKFKRTKLIDFTFMSFIMFKCLMMNDHDV